MDGYILLADGLRLDGRLLGAPRMAVGWLAANTSVVGFQEMVTDPAYRGRILAFTYPEIGNVGVADAFSESSRVQIAGLLVRVLSECRSHYLSTRKFDEFLAAEGIPCLSGLDTRALAVHLRTEGEMTAAIAPAELDQKEVRERLAAAERPVFEPPDGPPLAAGGSGLEVAVLDLGLRRSLLQQLNACCDPVLFPYDADAASVMETGPAGVIVSDGPGHVTPSEATIETVRSLLGKLPVLGCGLGHVALGVALGCRTARLRRGHHGANYPTRNVTDGALEVTHQRHTVLLDRQSVESKPDVEVLWENLNDLSVEGIRGAGGCATGYQPILAAAEPGTVNAHLREFVEGLGRG